MSTTAIKNNLLVEISNKQILKIALPISLAMLVPQANFITNNYFLSEIGETELGAAGITGVYYLIFALVGNGLNSGLQGLMARRAGEQKPAEIGKLFSQAIWVALFFSVAGIIITYLFSPAFLAGTLKDATVTSEAKGFLQIRILGLPFLYFFQLSNAFLVGSNNSRYMKYAFAIEAGINILLDYLLIKGRHGFPALGFNGAAVASVIAEAVAVMVVLIIIFRKKFDRQFHLFANLKYNHALVGKIFNQSLPLIMQFLLSIIAWMLFYILIENNNDSTGLAISSVMRNMFGLFGIFAWSFASTSNAMVSNIIGQGKKDKVVFLINKITLLSFGLTACLCVLINIFPHTFLGLFSGKENFIEQGIPIVRIVSVGVLLMSVATVWLNGVTGIGNTRINLLIEIAAISLYTIYVWQVISVEKLGLVWAWASELLYWSVLFTLSFIYIKSGRWKKKSV